MNIGRQAKKLQKQVNVEKRKAKEAIAKNNIAGARIHAENAIRSHNEHLSYLKLQSQLEAVSSKLKAQEVLQEVSQAMTAVTSNLDQALSSMDVTQIGYTMEQFIEQSENLDLQTKYMDSAIGESTSSSTPQSQVNNLLQQIADENDLNIGDKLSGFNAPIGQPNALPSSSNKVGDDDLMSRLNALQGGASRP